MIIYALVFSLAAVVFNLTLPLMAGFFIVDNLGGSTYISSYAISFFCIGNMLGVPFGKPHSTCLNPIQLYIRCLAMLHVSWLLIALLIILSSTFFFKGPVLFDKKMRPIRSISNVYSIKSSSSSSSSLSSEDMRCSCQLAGI
ncbi:MAG: hypothetical protein LEGION0403_FIIPPAGN_02202 [Legionella sp.]|uniref:hypothetical protein n=1 Tax=Legionella sp. TaxID=459 RepID=UPI003D0B5ACB